MELKALKLNVKLEIHLNEEKLNKGSKLRYNNIVIYIYQQKNEFHI